MNAPDLFGQERALPTSALRPLPTPHQSDLFTATAETIAVRTGRPASAIRVDLLVNLPKAGPGFRCLLDHAMKQDRKTRRLYCPVCEGVR